MKSLVNLTFSFIILSIHLNFSNVSCWTVNCDKKGACYISVDNSNNSIYITPGIIPFTTDKNIIPLKNFTTISDDNWNINQTQIGYSLHGILTGSNYYECAGGLGECFNGCCRLGTCSQPLNVCTMYINDVKLVFLILGFFYIIVFILYWGLFYAFGVVYNSKPRMKKDIIYIRMAPPKIFMSDLEKNGVIGEPEKLERNENANTETNTRRENTNKQEKKD
jgi:hypothetical protein